MGVLVLLGCHDTAHERGLGAPCSAGDCEAGLVCAADEICRQPCNSLHSCPDGQSCTSRGACELHSFSYVRCYGGPGDEALAAIALTEDDHVVFGAVFDGPWSLGGVEHVPVGGTDWLVARLDANGEVVWSGSFGSEANDTLHDITITPDGNIVAVGSMGGPADLGGDEPTHAGGQDAVVLLLDGNGRRLASALHGTADNDDEARAVIALQNGELVVGGVFGAKGSRFALPSAMLDGFEGQGYVMALDHNLATTQTHRFDSRTCNEDNKYCFQRVTHLAPNPAGGYYATGVHDDEFWIADTWVTSFGFAGDAFLISFDAQHVPRWSHAFGGSSLDEASVVTVDESGRAFAGGAFHSRVAQYGGHTLTRNGTVDFAGGAFNVSGEHLFSLELGTTGSTLTGGAAFTQKGHLLLAGGLDERLTLGDASLLSAGGFDSWLGLIDEVGRIVRAERFGSAFHDRIVALDVNTRNGAFGVEAWGATSFRGIEVATMAGQDVCVALIEVESIGR